ncbi:regulatory-associated protein of mtor [Anaeramoeba ignava]|uniref:Regulatory-associated protein of mtor n=1 Tax=Anaeramoeba ignava TaxID=1746090 RepID=A0A9Q0LNR0_ANAIG|nr:regulatory-associated protein of mtor [Anaeramoeba ignava]
MNYQDKLFFFQEHHKPQTIPLNYLQKTDWRIKTRIKTTHGLICYCLNIGINPPDVDKPDNCSILQCWIDPFLKSQNQAIEDIEKTLEKQYKQWQPRILYEKLSDPYVEKFRKSCIRLKKITENRILFHYNGHGVPKPTKNQEIWIFNQNHTQYIPLSIYDVIDWLGRPLICVFDCAKADLLLPAFKEYEKIGDDLEKELEKTLEKKKEKEIKYIILAPCRGEEELPTNPKFPADLFTSCLTTPMKIALNWHFYSKMGANILLKNIDNDMINKIPGKFSDRKSALGELNWIFTSITDTIAWDILPHKLFHKLYRQDILVASLFRNYLLAERILHTMNCTTFTYPQIPSTWNHPLWKTWDFSVDFCISQLPLFMINPKYQFQQNTFFKDQLTAFEIWLNSGTKIKSGIIHLPIILQFLLSQADRKRALFLLARFLDLGDWAIYQSLDVGIFPYVLTLLQSSNPDLKNLLIFIWAKIICFDESCQKELVKDKRCLLYFIDTLSSFSAETTNSILSGFILSKIQNNNSSGKRECLSANLLQICLSKLESNDGLIRKWMCLCLSKLWEDYDEAKETGFREAAADKLIQLLNDSSPEVRASSIYALSTFIGNSSQNEEQKNAILSMSVSLLVALHDGSSIVRKELLIVLTQLICSHENKIRKIVGYNYKEKKESPQNSRNYDHESTVFSLWWDSLTQLCNDPFTEIQDLASNFTLRLKVYWKKQEIQKRSFFSDGETEYSDDLNMESNIETTTIMLPLKNRTRRKSKSRGENDMWKDDKDDEDDDSLYPNKNIKSISQSYTRGKLRRYNSSSSLLPNKPRGRVKSSIREKKINTSLKTSPRKFKEIEKNNEKDNEKESITDTSFFAENMKKTKSFNINQPINGKSPKPQKGKSPLQKNILENHLQGYDSDPEIGYNSEKESTIEPLVSNFYEWNCQYFKEPFMEITKNHNTFNYLNGKNINRSNLSHFPIQSSLSNYQKLSNTNITITQETNEEKKQEKRTIYSDELKELILEKTKKYLIENSENVKDKNIKFNEQKCVIDISSEKVNQVRFHPFQYVLFSSDNKGIISIWNWEKSIPNIITKFNNKNDEGTEITYMKLINEDVEENPLIMIGDSQGVMKIWGDYSLKETNFEPRLITGWKTFPQFDVLPKRSGNCIYDFNKYDGYVFVTTGTRKIKIWDICKELEFATIPTHCEHSIKSLCSDQSNPNLLYSGSNTGAVFIYDIRSKLSLVHSFQDHNSRVINVYKQREDLQYLVSGSVQGEIVVRDLSLQQSPISKFTASNPMTAFDIHDCFPLVISGSSNHLATAFDFGGESLNRIGYLDSFVIPKTGLINNISFHPYYLKVAISADSLIYIYGANKTNKK